MIFFEIVKGWFSSTTTASTINVSVDDATQQHTIENVTVVRLFSEQPKRTLFDEFFQNTAFDELEKTTAFDDVAQVTLFEE